MKQMMKILLLLAVVTSSGLAFSAGKMPDEEKSFSVRACEELDQILKSLKQLERTRPRHESRVSSCGSGSPATSVSSRKTDKQKQRGEISQSLKILLQEASQNIWAFNCIGLARSISILARIGEYSPIDQQSLSIFLGSWLNQTRSQMGRFESRYLINSLWSVARLDYSHQGLVGSQGVALTNVVISWLERTVVEMPLLDSQSLAKSIWTFARIGIKPGGAFIEGWLQRTVVEMSHFDSHALVKSLWAFVRLRDEFSLGEQQAFINAWIRRAESQISQFNLEALKSIIWSLGKLRRSGHFSEKVDQQITNQILRRLRDKFGIDLSASGSLVINLEQLDRARRHHWCDTQVREIEPYSLADTPKGRAVASIDNETAGEVSSNEEEDDEKVSAHPPEGDDVKEEEHSKKNKRGPGSGSAAGGRSWANIVAGDGAGCY